MDFEFIYNVPSEYTYSGRLDMGVIVKGVVLKDGKPFIRSLTYNGKDIWDINSKGEKSIWGECQYLARFHSQKK